MKDLTLEWIEKAEGDYITALRELRARRLPNFDAACFHAQQCVEKYLKARLQEDDIAFGKTHDLSVLLDLLLPVEPQWEVYRAHLRTLTAYAVEFRYSGESATKELAKEAVDIYRDVRKLIRQSLALF